MFPCFVVADVDVVVVAVVNTDDNDDVDGSVRGCNNGVACFWTGTNVLTDVIAVAVGSFGVVILSQEDLNIFPSVNGL